MERLSDTCASVASPIEQLHILITHYRKLSKRIESGRASSGRVKFDVSDIYAMPDPADLGLAFEATESIIEEIDELCPCAFYCTSADVDPA